MSPAAAMPTELAPITTVEALAVPEIGESAAKVEERRTSPSSNWRELIKVQRSVSGGRALRLGWDSWGDEVEIGPGQRRWASNSYPPWEAERL